MSDFSKAGAALMAALKLDQNIPTPKITIVFEAGEPPRAIIEQTLLDKREIEPVIKVLEMGQWTETK